MVVYYTIAGRKIGSHVLAMSVLGTTFGGVYLAMPSKQAKTPQGPPIVASSKDEEQFIQEFLKSAEADEKKAKQ